MTTLSSCDDDGNTILSSTISKGLFPEDEEALIGYRMDMDLALDHETDPPHQLKQAPDSITFYDGNSAQLIFDSKTYNVDYTYNLSDRGGSKFVAEVTFSIPAEMTLDNSSDASMYLAIVYLQPDGSATLASESGYTPVTMGLQYKFISYAVRLYKP